MPLLAFRLATIDIEKGRIWPYYTPDYEWIFHHKQKFSCRDGHRVPNAECGCGIITTLNYSDVWDVWEKCKDERLYGSLCWTVVQVLGKTCYDARGTLYAFGVFQWGILKPRWCSGGDFAGFISKLEEKAKYPYWIDTKRYLYTPDEAFSDVDRENSSLGYEEIYTSWYGERYALKR